MLSLRALLGRVVEFLLVFSALQFSWQACADTPYARAFIATAIVRPAVYLVNHLTPQVRAEAQGNRLRAAGGGLNIVNGCDGMETLFLLIAGFVVTPIPSSARWLGALAGLPLVYALNQARILALFYAYRRDPDWFDALHGLFAPLAMVLCIAAYFYAWLAIAHRTATSPA